jgi:hypothetical protein
VFLSIQLEKGRFSIQISESIRVCCACCYGTNSQHEIKEIIGDVLNVTDQLTHSFPVGGKCLKYSQTALAPDPLDPTLDIIDSKGTVTVHNYHGLNQFY